MREVGNAAPAHNHIIVVDWWGHGSAKTGLGDQDPAIVDESYDTCAAKGFIRSINTKPETAAGVGVETVEAATLAINRQIAAVIAKMPRVAGRVILGGTASGSGMVG